MQTLFSTNHLNQQHDSKQNEPPEEQSEPYRDYISNKEKVEEKWCVMLWFAQVEQIRLTPVQLMSKRCGERIHLAKFGPGPCCQQIPKCSDDNNVFGKTFAKLNKQCCDGFRVNDAEATSTMAVN